MPQNTARTSSGMRSAKAPPGDPTAARMITGTGWPDARATREGTEGMTKRSGIMKRRPQNRLRKMVRTIAFGT